MVEWPTRALFKIKFSGKATGTSEMKSAFLGGDYVQHFDEKGHKSGTSEAQKRFLTNKDYLEHKDTEGNVTGTSESDQDFFWKQIHAQHC